MKNGGLFAYCKAADTKDKPSADVSHQEVVTQGLTPPPCQVTTGGGSHSGRLAAVFLDLPFFSPEAPLAPLTASAPFAATLYPRLAEAFRYLEERAAAGPAPSLLPPCPPLWWAVSLGCGVGSIAIPTGAL